VIGKAMLGKNVGGLIRYLYGPGKANEHVDPHLVAGFTDVDELEPSTNANGRKDFRRLVGMLEQPVKAAAVDPATKPVWHCALRCAPDDRRLTDAEWGEIARDVVARTGLAGPDDDGGCRWVAARHGDDHIHLVVTLARQDGRRPRLSNDYHRVGEACRAAEQRYGLRVTAKRDRTAAQRASRAEQEKAQRDGRSEPARVTLRREVRTAAAGADGLQEFLDRLRDAGLLIKERTSDRDPGTLTGYAVAWPGDRDGRGRPVWYGGGKLAADLSLPKLQQRWSGGHPRAGSSYGGPQRSTDRLSAEQRRDAWERAARTAATAAKDVRRLAHEDPAAAADAAHAAGEVLHITALLGEGTRVGPITAAADAFDRAAGELYGRVPRPTPSGDGLRTAARMLALCGRASRDESTQLLSLVLNLAALADAVGALREAQTRVAQAAAARDTAERLRSVAPQPPPRRPPAARAQRPFVRLRPSPVRAPLTRKELLLMLEDQHSDPTNESVARLAQIAAMGAGVMEAVVRLRAQLAAERTAEDSQAAQAARAQRLADHATARVVWSPAFDGSWLRQADASSAARAWGASRPWADTDPDAARAMSRCEDRLRNLHPDAMCRFDRLRAGGASPEDAMSEAAPLFERERVARTGSPATPRPAITQEATAAGAVADAERPGALAAGVPRDKPATRVDANVGAAPNAARDGVAGSAPARAAGARAPASLAAEDFPRPHTNAISSTGIRGTGVPHAPAHHSSPRPQVR